MTSFVIDLPSPGEMAVNVKGDENTINMATPLVQAASSTASAIKDIKPVDYAEAVVLDHLRMAKEVEVPPVESPEMKSFASRVNDLPVVMEAVKQLGMLYNNVKERNSVTKMACEAGENTINMATPLIQAASSTAMAIKPVDYAATTIDHVACETLAKVEEKLPIITKTPEEIKYTLTATAKEYFDMVQDSAVAKLLVTQAESLVSFTELVTEIVLPTDGNCKEDMEELEVSEDNKGPINRTKMMTCRLARRSKTKLLTYKHVKLSQDTITSVHGHLSDLLSTSQDVGKKVFDAYMYVPSKAIQVSGAVYVSTKKFVFAFSEAHDVRDMPAALLGMARKAYEPLADIKDKAIAYVYIPDQTTVDYVLSSRPVQWIVPKSVMTEITDIILGEIEDDTESEIQENVDSMKEMVTQKFNL